MVYRTRGIKGKIAKAGGGGNRGPDANETIIKSEQGWYVDLREIKEGIAGTGLGIETPSHPGSPGLNKSSISNFEARTASSDEAG